MMEMEREATLGRMLELLAKCNDTKKTAFVNKAARELGTSRTVTRSLLDEAVGRGFATAKHHSGRSWAERASIYLERTDKPFVPKAMSTLDLPEVWIDVPGSLMAYQVSNRGRLRKLVPASGDDGDLGYEYVALECLRGSGRFGWTIRRHGIACFLYRGDMLKRFGDVPCATDPAEERLAVEKMA